LDGKKLLHEIESLLKILCVYLCMLNVKNLMMENPI
jgi:hypothetical protein